MNDSLYKEEILEHFHDPQNFGVLENYSSKSKQLNPFCGDEIEMFVLFENGVASTKSILSEVEVLNREMIQEVSFVGKGCAISIASSSILTEYLKGKSKGEVKAFSDKDMLDLLQIEISETRKKCALLALAVLKDCL